MKNHLKSLQRVAAVALCLAVGGAWGYATTDITHGKWTVRVDENSQYVTLLKDGTSVLNDVTARFAYNGTVYQTAGYGTAEVSQNPYAGAAGNGTKVVILYQAAGLPTVEQSFYLIDGADFLLTDVALAMPNGGELESNYICPIFSEATNLFLPQDVNNRFLTVPYDNDGFITYGSFPLSRPSSASSNGAGRFARDSISMEVTAIFNGVTQRGMVLGSVTHDTWKSAIRIKGSPMTQGSITRLECFSGVTHAITRDERNGVLQPHGAVKGQRVASATMLLGLFDDWRTGHTMDALLTGCCVLRYSLSTTPVAPLWHAAQYRAAECSRGNCPTASTWPACMTKLSP